MKKVETIIVFLIFLIMFSCTKDEPSIPDTVVPPDTLVDILVDIHIIESALGTIHSQKGDTIRNVTMKLYNNLFNKYGLNFQRFEETMNFYANNPSIFEKAYTQALVKLVKIQSEVKHKKTIKKN